MRTTMRQVAEQAGVSHVTVTNVLRGRTSRVSAKTRERVLRTVNELGYVPVSQPASQRRHVETRIIGVMFDQIELGRAYSATNAYLGLSASATNHAYDLLMLLRPLPEWAPERAELQFLDRRCDGFVFVAPVGRKAVLDKLVENNIPVVACFSEDVPDGVGWVTGDNRSFVQQALRHLVQQGHRRIAFLDGPPHNSDIRRRGDHFAALASEEGVTHARRFAGYDVVNSVNVIGPALEQMVQWGATAALCCNDGFAFGLWDAANASGLRVPEDLSLVGIDGFPESAPRGLTTVEMDGESIAAGAIDCWVELHKGADYRDQRRYYPGELIERATVRAV